MWKVFPFTVLAPDCSLHTHAWHAAWASGAATKRGNGSSLSIYVCVCVCVCADLHPPESVENIRQQFAYDANCQDLSDVTKAGAAPWALLDRLLQCERIFNMPDEDEALLAVSDHSALEPISPEVEMAAYRSLYRCR